MIIDEKGNRVASDFKHGLNFSIGFLNLIKEKVRVGDNVKIESYVELRSGTIVGDDCKIDSGVSSSGDNRVGNRVTIRYKSILARGVIIEDDIFISPKLMTENLNHRGEEIGGAHIGTGEWDRKTPFRVFIGTGVTLASGIEICSGTIIGSHANVRKSIIEPGVYVGNPARLLVPRNPKIKIGKNVRIEPGAIIGGQPTAFEGDEIREPLEGIRICDHAWIGPGAVIMLGLTRDTYIGERAKIGALCNIAHDVRIEKGALIINGTQIAGYAEIGKLTIVGLGSRIRERVKIGRGSIIGMGSNVLTDIPDNVVAWGNPCRMIRKREHTLKHYARMFLR